MCMRGSSTGGCERAYVRCETKNQFHIFSISFSITAPRGSARECMEGINYYYREIKTFLYFFQILQEFSNFGNKRLTELIAVLRKLKSCLMNAK